MPIPPLAPLTRLDTATLDWDDEDTATASRFGDVYFSREDGRQESEFVFIQHNRLPERLAGWTAARPFVIGETGLGSGLNVLCAWQCFEAHAAPEARLHIVSFERYPLTQADARRMLSAWPSLSAYAEILIRQWPHPVLGVHRLHLDDRVTLDLHFGDVHERLAQFAGKVDAWFLDGFAPAKNPQMWQPALFDAMSRSSHPHATFATFTCAGDVRRGLSAAGFSWAKVPGFGRKREMLCGQLEEALEDTRRQETPWFMPPTVDVPREVTVIGAGIAGTSTANALARRGLSVTLIDPQPPGSEASGNRQGAMYVKLAVETNPQSRMYLASLLYLRRLLAERDPSRALWSPCGVLTLAQSEQEMARQQRFLAFHALPEAIVRGVSAEEATTLAGTTLGSVQHALFYPNAGWVRPHRLCQLLADHPLIHYRQAAVSALHRTSTGGWTLTLTDGGQLASEAVVVASAWQANQLEPLAHLPLMPIRGQVSDVDVAPGTPSAQCVVCASGYAPPQLDGKQCFGASFVPRDTSRALRIEEHHHNFSELEAALPTCAEALREQGSDERMQGRTGIRCASPDKSPLVGPAPDAAQWHEAYATLRHDARLTFTTPGHHHAGLWINTAHGSRGMVSAPLCAELLASQICQEPLPLEMALVDHLHPGRRIISDLKRNRQ